MANNDFCRICGYEKKVKQLKTSHLNILQWHYPHEYLLKIHKICDTCPNLFKSCYIKDHGRQKDGRVPKKRISISLWDSVTDKPQLTSTGLIYRYSVSPNQKLDGTLRKNNEPLAENEVVYSDMILEPSKIVKTSTSFKGGIDESAKDSLPSSSFMVHATVQVQQNTSRESLPTSCMGENEDSTESSLPLPSIIDHSPAQVQRNTSKEPSSTSFMGGSENSTEDSIQLPYIIANAPVQVHRNTPQESSPNSSMDDNEDSAEDSLPPPSIMIHVPVQLQQNTSRESSLSSFMGEYEDSAEDSQQSPFMMVHAPVKVQRKSQRESSDKIAKQLIASVLTGDDEGLKEIETSMGSGVATSRLFQRGEFVATYQGELITRKEAEARESALIDEENARIEREIALAGNEDVIIDKAMKCYMMFFVYNNDEFCIDATIDNEGQKTLGRLINHSKKKQNIIPQKIYLEGRPYIYFKALINISPNTELFYDYNDLKSSFEWMKQ